MKRGYTFFEILIVFLIISILFLKFQISLSQRKMNFYQEIYSLKTYIESLRSEAILKGESYKLEFRGNTLYVKRKASIKWKLYRVKNFPGLNFSSNNSPIISPEGFMSSLSSVYVFSKKFYSKFTFSITGKLNLKFVLLR